MQIHERMLNAMTPDERTKFEADQSHGLRHAKETLQNVLQIAEGYGVDQNQLVVAAFFHDVGNIRLFHGGQYNHEIRHAHEEEGTILVEQLLKRIGENPAEFKEALQAIRIHDSGPHASILEKIICDADRLGSLGKNAVERPIQYGQQLQDRPFFNPTIPLEERLDWRPGIKHKKEACRDTIIPILYNSYRRGDPRAYYTNEAKKILKEKIAETIQAFHDAIKGRSDEQEILEMAEAFRQAVQNEKDFKV